MKKLFIIILFGLFLYGCSEINDPIKVNDKSTKSVISNTDNNVQAKLIILKRDSTGIVMLSDSVRPPYGSVNADDSVRPPYGSTTMGIPVLKPLK